MRFPEVASRDLEGRERVLPDDLPAGPRVLLVAFQRWHQLLVDSWGAGLDGLVEEFPGLTVWEVPALSRAYALGRFYIDGGMRAGIPNIDTRRHTLTAYTDLNKLAQNLELPDLGTIYVLLLDETGEVVWRQSGEASAEKVASLREALLKKSASAAAG